MKKFEFNFTPQELIAVKEEIKRRFPSANQSAQERKNRYQQVNLEEILKEIEQLSDNKLTNYAGGLKNREVYALAYSFNQIPSNLLKQVKMILTYRFKKSMVKIMWNNFSKRPDNQYITYFFKEVIDQIKKIKFTNTPYNLIKGIFSAQEPIGWVIDYIINLNLSYSDWVDYFQLTESSELVQSILADLFTRANKRIFTQEDAQLIFDLFSSLGTESFRKSAENYLELFKVEEFNEELMYLFKDRIGDPVEDYFQSWKDISNIASKKARQWFNTKEMEEFFSSIDANKEEAQRRFEYWKKYNHSIEKVKYVRNRLQLFLLFNKFAVIEFGEKGNAAYIYDRGYFNKHFANHMDKYNSVNNDRLKSRIDNFVGTEDNRIIHRDTKSTSWEQKADRKIKMLFR
ncbi:EH signature domain-containing protein [Natroniella acetigena]|uniref:EH signature domain-containing protein n=1 Tax=Natroniella acetigena TaxID=52004 RepID=UPI00200B4C13|nr:EH signature domain-containing protein [Natroniella acetigena]MCK8827935.1 EH signature domain-containing protein [Natroniella acetigena]